MPTIEVTHAELARIEQRRERDTQRAAVTKIVKEYAAGDISLKDGYRRVLALASGERDCNCPSQFDMCWTCQHCLKTRVRANILY